MPASDRSDVARREPGGPASTAKKPVTLQFGVDDAPPLGVTLLCAVQHIGVMAIFLVVPLLLARQAAAPAEVVTSVLGLSMLALGIGTLLQASPRLGSGYLVPPVFTGIYVGPSLQAVQSGGLPLMAGMTIAAGVAEGALSRTVRHLRPFMPPELAGLVIFLTGTTTAAIGLRYLLRGAGPLSAAQWLVAVATLVPMVGLSVWTKGRLRIVCALVGMATGSLAALTTGGLAGGALAEVALGPVVALPRLGHVGWAFDPLLLVPFGIGALAATLKTVGLVSLSQRMNDTGWVRPEMRSITRGVLADGVGTTVSGLFGTVGGNSAPSCVGLAAATGVASRRVAYAIGAILILLAFVPAFPRLFALLPPPVVGSVLVFTACFTLLNGIETIASRMLDTRKTLVIGLAIVAALAADVFPEIFKTAPASIRPMLESSLVFGTLTGILLNTLFRLGVRQRVALTIEPAEYDPVRVEDFMEERGAAWGARREIVRRATYAIHQCVETLLDAPETTGPFSITVAFDEFNLDVQVRYTGAMLELPERRPTEREILEVEGGDRRLAGFLLRRVADRASSSRDGDRCVVTFHFEH
ncbi:MAG TPA: solute carrier family 23 protein [Methylomirabilota bacterium]|nr:solute carrier family 23 protein [Methylomirabilota bacterium]